MALLFITFVCKKKNTLLRENLAHCRVETLNQFFKLQNKQKKKLMRFLVDPSENCTIRVYADELLTTKCQNDESASFVCECVFCRIYY